MRITSIMERGLGRFVCVVAGLGATCAALGQVQEDWAARYNGPVNGIDAVYALAVDAAGNVYVTGDSDGSGTGFDYATVKYGPGGNLLWQMRYDGPVSGVEFANAIAVDGAGNVIVTGGSEGFGSGFDVATVKYGPTGTVLWERRYNGPGNGGDGANALAVDAAGNVYVAGGSFGAGTSWDYATFKYGPNGNLLWLQHYNGPANGMDDARALTIDSAGNVYVTGESSGFGTGDDYVTLKYDTDGNLQWERRYDGPANGLDRATAIAVDGSGNVYVTGVSDGVGTDGDYATIKYAPDGFTLWERRYNGPSDLFDVAHAVAVDGAGNVIVTGGAAYFDTAYDYTTLKYGPSGNLLWLRRYNGPANAYDAAHALAVDGAGNVYVTGDSSGTGTGQDYATVKYDSDGVLRWAVRYNGPGNGLESVFTLALDGAGNVHVAGRSLGVGTDFDYATVKYSQIANVVVPDSFSVVRGVLTGGGLSDLYLSDDLRLEVRAGLTLFLGESPLQVVVTGTATVEVPSELRFKLEASANTPGLTQTIELFNYDTSSYEQVDLSMPGASDGIVEVVVTTNPGRFVQAGTREMRAKVLYRQVGLTLLWPWSAKLDHAVWTTVP